MKDVKFDTLYKLKSQLTLSESYEEFPYVDTVGKISIGIGHNLTDRGLSKQVIDQIYEEDVKVAIEDLDKIFSDFDWRSLSENRQLVLLDMSFNMGYDRFSRFFQTIEYIRKELFQEAAVQMLRSKWAKQVKGRAKKLARMMEQG